MAAVIRSLLKTECLEVGSYFMLVTISTRNYSGATITFGPYKEENAVSKPTQTLLPDFAMDFALIFHRDHRGIEDTFDIR
uniref:Uncharacterized protein n=1 Tax=Candidatus Kentrum sp. FW TaxID=2126338 RepID=A0A450SY82_9GAMM|nr:MAG: hypothetical protein BECKFW1821B_GA0114236_10464 [Candidatus Kentron sp. FW]